MEIWQIPTSWFFVEVLNFESVVSNNDLNILITLKKDISSPIQNIRGYVSVTIKNGDASTPKFKSASKGTIDEFGFPTRYYRGLPFNVSNKIPHQTIRIKLKISNSNDYYTDAILFVHTQKGGLLAKQSLKLNGKINL